MNPDRPTPGPEQEATPTTPSQSDGHTPPPTPPSITTSITELGEHLEEKNAAAESDPLTSEQPA